MNPSSLPDCSNSFGINSLPTLSDATEGVPPRFATEFKMNQQTNSNSANVSSHLALLAQSPSEGTKADQPIPAWWEDSFFTSPLVTRHSPLPPRDSPLILTVSC
jgi:hypothetical protein